MNATPQRRRSRFWVVAAAVNAVPLALWGANAWSSARAEVKRQAHLAELTKAIEVALPAGSTASQVIAFLDARHIQHSDFDERTRAVYASSAEEQVNLLFRTGVYLVFHFDGAARMTNFSVEQKATGL
jgi:hypothetical protein